MFVGAKCRSGGPSSKFGGHPSLEDLVLCGQPATLRSSAAGSPQSVTPLAGTSHVKKSNRLLLRGKPSACSSPAAIPPHLVPFPPPCGPRHASAIAPATLRSVLGSKATKCSGQPGYGRPGRWRRVCQDKPATHCAGGLVPGFAINVLLLLDRG